MSFSKWFASNSEVYSGGFVLDDLETAWNAAKEHDANQIKELEDALSLTLEYLDYSFKLPEEDTKRFKAMISIKDK